MDLSTISRDNHSGVDILDPFEDENTPYESAIHSE